METENKQITIKIPLLLLVGVLLFSFGVSAVSAAGTDNSTIYVNTQGNDSWDGLSPVYNTTSGPKKTITNATGTVATNGTVHIAQGTYNESGITINTNMTITGENQDNTIINGQQSGNSIFIIADGITFNINNLKLTNSTAMGNGGAIYNEGNLTVINSTLTNNTATNYGGAIYNDGGLTVTNCTLTGNTASNGGAITNFFKGSLAVTSTTLTGNSATCNGGSINNYGSLTVTDSTFAGNTAASYGGAIENYGTLTLTNSTLTGNSAAYTGGAIFNAMMGTSTVTNCTLTGNTATIYGGAIYNGGSSTVTVTNSTLKNNTVINDGGAIYNDGNVTVTNSTLTGNNATNGGAIFNEGYITVTNSTLTGNNATNGGAIYNNYYVTLTVTNCTLTGNSATNGGAIYNRNNQVTVVRFSSIVNNSASLGSAIYDEYGVIDAKYNWWGSNNPVWTDLIAHDFGIIDNSTWLYMTINPRATSINNTQSILVTVSFNNLYNGTTVTSFDPSTGHIPDGTLVTYSSTLGSFNPATATTVNGIATSLFTAKHGGTGNLNATTDNQTATQLFTVNPVSYLYLNTTTSKNPTTDKTFIVTYKLSNNGPDNATNVTVSFQIPAGLEFVSASVDNGKYTYNPNNRTITWTLSNVAVGDPYLYLTVRASGAGSYTITPTITSETFNQNTDPLTPFTFNVQQNNSNGNTVNAASTTKTVPMQTTGMPIAGLVLAILAVLGGTLAPRKK